jgi:hypothetical protein
MSSDEKDSPPAIRGGDLTQAEFEAIHNAKARDPQELQVTVTDDGLVQVGNDLGQMYYQLTPEMASTHITHLMEARQKAHAIRKIKAGGV